MKILISNRNIDIPALKLFNGFKPMDNERVNELSRRLKQEGHKSELIEGIYQYQDSCDIRAIKSNGTETLGHLDIEEIRKWITEGDLSEELYMIIHEKDIRIPIGDDFKFIDDRTIYYRGSNERIMSFFEHECKSIEDMISWVKGIFIVDKYIQENINGSLDWDVFLAHVNTYCADSVKDHFKQLDSDYFTDSDFEIEY